MRYVSAPVYTALCGMIRIHNFPRGARGLRVMWLCEEMSLPYEVELVSFPPSEAYRTLHPLGSVPFLEDEGGVAINESVAMLLYLAQRYGPTSLLPGREDARLARVLQLTEFGEATLGAGLNPLLMARFAAPEAEKRNWSVRSQEDRVAQAVRYVAQLLGDSAFLAGGQFTLADISMSPALGLWHGVLGQPLPGSLPAYLERTNSRPAYQRAQLRCRGAAASGTT
jgi:glutathione S-transferase